MLAKHLKAGAFLVQCKRGMDLLSSLGDQRIMDSLARMQEFGHKHSIVLKPAQMILLFVGFMAGHSDESVTVNDQAPHGAVSYWQVMGALERWSERGGTFSQITHVGLLPKWLQLKESHAKDNYKNKDKLIIPKPDEMYDGTDEPLQIPIRVKDGRLTLITMPHIGTELANALWREFNGNLLRALEHITDPEYLRCESKIKGIGKVIINDNRGWLGMADNTIIQEVARDE